MDTTQTSHSSIDRAMVPAAGLGTRMRPLTQAIPKEMLPIGRKPVLEHVLDELKGAGIRRVLFIVSPGKDIIHRYFGDGDPWGVRCDYALQPQMRGLGDALLCGEQWCEGEPTAVAFGDCIIEANATAPSPLERLVDTFCDRLAAAAVLTERVPRERTSRYGILAPASPLPGDGRPVMGPFQVAGIVEKPEPDRAPSTQAVAARWVLGPDVFAYLRRQRPGPDGEVSLTDAVAAMLADRASVWAAPLLRGEARRDIGGWETYLVATAKAACRDPEFGERVRASLG